jgi:hypothetical protein
VPPGRIHHSNESSSTVEIGLKLASCEPLTGFPRRSGGTTPGEWRSRAADTDDSHTGVETGWTSASGSGVITGNRRKSPEMADVTPLLR